MNIKICLSLLGWKENILYKEYIVQWCKKAISKLRPKSCQLWQNHENLLSSICLAVCCQQTVVKAFIYINISNSNNINKYWVGICNSLSHIIQARHHETAVSQCSDSAPGSNKKRLESSTSSVQVRLWNVEAGTSLLTFSDPENFVRCVALHGQRIVSGDFGGEVHLWDLKFKDKEGNFEVTNHRKWECHKGHIVCIQLSASRIVTGSRDKTLMVSDFWLKTVDSLGPKESESGRMRHSRFLKRDIMSL